MGLIEELYTAINTANLWDKEIQLNRHDILKQKNTTDSNLYYVVNGSLRIFICDENEEHTIRFGYKNNFITALDSFITEKPSDLIIQALKHSQLKIISKQKYLAFIKSDKKYISLWEQLLINLIQQQMERERDILTSSPLQRYKRVLMRSPQLFQEVPHKYIASYLRMSPETLSRIKKS